MMKTCVVKDIVIGEGKPKICLPIVGQTDQEIMEIAQSFKGLEYDLVELRIDFYIHIFDDHCLLEMLQQLRKIIEKPLLLTYRSLKEGGQIQLTDEQYLHLIEIVCQSQMIDLVDIELMSGNALVYQLVEIAHQNGIKVIMSNHDFHQTPSRNELIERFEHMEILNADIYKIAVMPCSYKDVIELLNVTLEMSHKMDKPLVTMSMGKLGVISRITGELTGSAITFASAGKASAPGQIGVQDMNMLLGAIHHD